MEKKINKTGRRLGIASMAVIMTLAVPFASPVFAAPANEKTSVAGENKDNKNNSQENEKKSTSIFEDKAKMKKIFTAVESAAEAIGKKYPTANYITTPLLMIVKALYNNEHPEVTLDTISAQLVEIKGQIENAKQEMISAMSTITEMHSFVEAYNEFERAYREMSAQISQISGYKDMDHSVKDAKLSGLIGTRNDWVKRDNVISAYTILGDYLSASRKLSSGNKSIYDTMISHYSRQVLFGKEAMDKTDNFVKNAVAIYMEGTAQLINCLLAEKNHLIRLNTPSSKCDAEYCEYKMKSILEQVVKVNEALDKYQSYNPRTFYDRSGGTQKDITLSKDIGKVDFSNKKQLKDIIGGKALSKTQMEYIVKYVKNTYPNKTFQEFLQYIGYGSLNARDYLMVDKGGVRSANMNIGIHNSYYFYGIRLNEKNKDSREVGYLSRTVCITSKLENLSDGNMVYLTA
ncbi:MAG: hypothetical protein IKN79_08695 [Eubacterium sp.]|nr:hypothetical protein [Eubacterium sp.]